MPFLSEEEGNVPHSLSSTIRSLIKSGRFSKSMRSERRAKKRTSTRHGHQRTLS